MASLEIESTLTDRYQTTVPDVVRRTLKLRKRDKIRYVVRPDGAVLLTRAEAGEETLPIFERHLGIRNVMFAATILLAILGITLFIGRLPNDLNIDFVGGTAYGGKLTSPLTITELRQLVEEY